MNEKQLLVHLLAYNVIRLLMAQAASNAGVDPRGLSFKHTVQLWDRMGRTRTLCHGRLPAAIHTDRTMQGRPSARAH